MKLNRVSCILAIGAGALAAAGCNLAPRYARPTAPPSVAFKEAGPDGDAALQGWKRAAPNDAAIRTRWWELYEDPRLDEIEARVAISNQTIVAAEANYRAAYALAQEAQAQLFPTLSLAPSATREKSSRSGAVVGGGVAGASTVTAAGASAAATTGSGATTATSGTHNLFAVPLEASYQVDLWGSIRNTVAGSRYSAQASAATLANALLSTQSTLAQDYFQLRVADEQRRILEATVEDYRASLHLVRTLVDTGVDSEADAATAESQLETAMASATDVGVARAQYEHAIAVLIGVAPGSFSIPYQRLDQKLPIIPVSVPSDLLERRPDIAAAERQVAAANAQIGVARAAFFPALTLSGSGGYESTAVSNLFSAPNLFWSVGPSLAQILFDGGARAAAVAQARALDDSQVATYRQTVLNAFQSVEDNLAALRILATELDQSHRATAAAARALRMTLVLYRNGIDSYVSVITAQNALLAARETELGVRLRQLTASVNLINDLGGGWRSSDLEQTERLAQHPPDAAREPEAPRTGPADLANPPPIPTEEIRLDELMELDESMRPAPSKNNGPPRSQGDP
jgi:NodT family efflux transporter outer membrane factor (OMF) lipoprotein